MMKKSLQYQSIDFGEKFYFSGKIFIKEEKLRKDLNVLMLKIKDITCLIQQLN